MEGKSSSREQDGGTTDSLTFGQLKKMVAQQRIRPRETKYGFEYTQQDTLAHELEDWHAYSQESILSYLLRSYTAEVSTPWTKTSSELKASILDGILDRLLTAEISTKAHCCAVLSYIAQGCYGEARSTEHQIHLIMENATLFRTSKAFDKLFQCLRECFDQLADGTTWSEDADILEDCIRESSSCIYFVMQASRTRPDFSRELRNAAQSIVSYLMRVIARLGEPQDDRLRRVSLRHTALLLRSAILCSLGGHKEISKCKAYQRRRAHLPAEDDKHSIITTPLDYAQFRSELTSKYPSYNPPALHEEAPEDVTEDQRVVRSTFLELPVYTDGQWSSTPAPSPPPSPKGKKSLYTTDQTVPFVLPLGEALSNRIPTSIEEGASLFHARQRTTVPLMQLWQEQENFVKSERGWKADEDVSPFASPVVLDDDSRECEERLAEVERIYSDSLPDLQGCISSMLTEVWNVSSLNLPAAGLQSDKEVDNKIEESVANTRGWLFGDKPNSSDKKETTPLRKSAREKEDFRELEILMKGITGSLLLCLKWFRVSHILKFEFFSQLLIDADWIHTFHQATMALNPATNVAIDHDDPQRNYFTVCASLSDHSTSETSPDTTAVEKVSNTDSAQDSPTRSRTVTHPGKDLPLISKFSWRNFYSVINMLKITQKLVKKKVHRNLMLVQAKTWLHLRRPLRIPHEYLQLCCLKLYKGQVPLCSRKWRMSNMKVITQIYMSCRPELREDWIAGTEVDVDLKEADQHESAIRALTMYYNIRNYPEQMESMGFTEDAGSDSDDDFFETEVRRANVEL